MSVLRGVSRAVLIRVLVMLTLAGLSYVGIGRAEAATNPYPDNGVPDTCASNTTIQCAYSKARKMLNDWNASCLAYSGWGQVENHSIVNNAAGMQLVVTAKCIYRRSGNASDGSLLSNFNGTVAYSTGCGTDSFNTQTGQCETPCSERPEETGWLYDAEHQTACHEGCSYYGAINVDDGSTSYAPDGNSCTVGPENPAPTLDTDGDGVADDDDAFPTDPGESNDSDGDGVGDNGDPYPNDPTDGSDDGTGNETDNNASGGGTCGTPPVCSGDAIQCNTLFQQWKTRCEVESSSAKVTGTPEICASSYTCTGNTAQCAKVKLLRVVACKEASGTAGSPGDANENGLPDVLESGDGYEPGSTDGFIGTDDGTGMSSGIDDSGWLSGGGTCPGLPPFLGDNRIGQIACDQGALIKSMLTLLAFVFASVIIGRAAAGSGA